MQHLKYFYCPYQRPNVGSMLGHCLLRWSSIETLLDKCILIIICRGAQRVSVWSRLSQKAPIDKLYCTMYGASSDMYIIEPTSINIVIHKIQNKSGITSGNC